MTTLLLALVLAAGAGHASGKDLRDDDRARCSVDVRAVDEVGRYRPARRVSASTIPAVVFRGEQPRNSAPLVFDVFNPHGQRYQVLLAAPLEKARGRRAQESRVREAALPVAGSSIAWTSMFGKWRVEPRIEGQPKPCGTAEYFTIRP